MHTMMIARVIMHQTSTGLTTVITLSHAVLKPLKPTDTKEKLLLATKPSHHEVNGPEG